jgi:hypothetical protein
MTTMKNRDITQDTLLKGEKDPLTSTPVHLLELDKVGKHYGNLRPRRQRRRQIHADQDRRRPAQAR